MTDPTPKQLAAKLRNDCFTNADLRAIADFLDPPQPEGGVPVRIAVAENSSGRREAAVVQPDDLTDQSAFDMLDDYDNFNRNRRIITAVLPPPAVPVGKVEVERP